MTIKAEILSVGTELLLGDIVNTNARFISKGLASLGIHLYRQGVVGDNPLRIKEEIINSLERSDLLIITGGLGPTTDDLTREVVAETLNRPLIQVPEILEGIQAFFNSIGVEMEKSNVKQSYIPQGATWLENNNGTSPGLIVEEKEKKVILLPGPPKEMEPMFEKQILPYLSRYGSGILKSKILNVFGIGESTMEARVEDILEEQTNPTVAPYCMEQGLILRVTAKAESEEEANREIAVVEKKLRERLGEYIYGVNNESLEEVVVSKLKQYNESIGIAESCTGGMLAATLTGVPGVSDLFPLGITTYSNESKVKILGVSEETIRQKGAVSSETAIEMAKRIRALSNTTIGVGVTGIAGHTGGSIEKPVGLIYIAIDYRGEIHHIKKQLFGKRNEIRRRATNHSLDLIRKVVKG